MTRGWRAGGRLLGGLRIARGSRCTVVGAVRGAVGATGPSVGAGGNQVGEAKGRSLGLDVVVGLQGW